MKKYIKYICLILFLNFNFIVSQELKLNAGYISDNKLEYIFIMKNKSFGYNRYYTESPYSVKKIKKKKSNYGCNTKGYIIEQSGSGTYIIKNDSIILSFVTPKSYIDSVKIENMKTEKFENLCNLKFIPHYNHPKSGMPSIYITDKEGRNVANDFENNFTANIERNRFPLSLSINGEYNFKIENGQNLEIKLYVNCFKTHKIETNEIKIYPIKLFKIIKEN